MALYQVTMKCGDVEETKVYGRKTPAAEAEAKKIGELIDCDNCFMARMVAKHPTQFSAKQRAAYLHTYACTHAVAAYPIVSVPAECPKCLAIIAKVA